MVDMELDENCFAVFDSVVIAAKPGCFPVDMAAGPDKSVVVEDLNSYLPDLVVVAHIGRRGPLSWRVEHCSSSSVEHCSSSSSIDSLVRSCNCLETANNIRPK
jgi:hypothetical protein